VSQTHGGANPFGLQQRREEDFQRWLKTDGAKEIHIPDDPGVQLFALQLFTAGWMACYQEMRPGDVRE
jgi:hypothetical protein